ncbi:hypothetical protein EsH8_V_000493 [Colletotrichum jinshuiense]
MAYYYQNVQGGHIPHDQLYYEQQNYAQMSIAYTDGSTTSNSCTPVDPSLESYSQSQFQTSWPGNQPHQIQQYIDGPRTSFFVTEKVHPVHNFGRQAQETNALLPASQRRHGSPCSQQTLSSSDSNSPPTECDVLPATPPDYSAASPFLQHKQYAASWETQQFQIQTLLGLSMPGSACVNPHEVNLSQAMFEDEVVPTDFNNSRTFSFCCSESDASSAPQQSPFSSRQITPDGAEPVIKEELQTVELSYQPIYPDPEPVEQDAIEAEIKVEPHVTLDDDRDMDYKPRPSRKRSRNAAAKAPAHSADSTHDRKRPRVNSSIGGPPPTRLNATVPSARNSKILCTECKTPFSDESTYQKHMKQHHTRPFVCVFNYAGCPSTFASKNEWKRHVSSQHLALQYWLCTQDGCSKTTNPPTNRRVSSSPCSAMPTPPALPNGAIFNRKDLYTQHVRRMHVPPDVRKAQKQKKPTADWDEHLKALQADAEKTRCDLPRHMRCPAVDCGHEFNGAQAWDERMEHLARHLERAADGKEPMVHFGGDNDPSLTLWASSAEVYVVRQTSTPGNWELINPLKGEIGPSSGNGKGGSSGVNTSSSLKEIVVASCSDEDAEGEDEE